ncbi:nuclear transport factor 2 family protein [Hydrogenovibrio halophilus]|uniref:nuclear transport factor 2 family protein n=1 Tax=Hydrogenovibrio halophilus TaxID=373391 RepID=UPI000376991A|nr:nuclear transport factor 2 family protein [Hydrogenovibrio halophilus]
MTDATLDRPDLVDSLALRKAADRQPPDTRTPSVQPLDPDNRYCQALLMYVHAFENLTPTSLFEQLLPLFATNAYFEDPFNQVVGRQAIGDIFEHMFEHTITPRFVVMNYAINGRVGFLRWEMSFYDQKLKLHRIVGTSKVGFDRQGQVLSHTDYWDTGRYLYQKVPLLGRVIRWINRKLTPHAGKR